MTTVALASSILSADFARLGEQVAEAEAAGADRLHVDVMDGHFVPNITIGPVIVRSLRRVTRLPLGDQRSGEHLHRTRRPDGRGSHDRPPHPVGAGWPACAVTVVSGRERIPDRPWSGRAA